MPSRRVRRRNVLGRRPGRTTTPPVLVLISGPADNTPNFVVTPGVGETLDVGDTLRAFWSINADLSAASFADNTIDPAEAASGQLSFSTGALANGQWYFGVEHIKPGRAPSAMSNTEDEVIAAIALGTTWNPANKTANMDLSNGNLTALHANNGIAVGAFAWSIASYTSGKHYWKTVYQVPPPAGSYNLLTGISTDGNNQRGFDVDSVALWKDGSVLQNSVTLATVTPFDNTNTVHVAVDLDAHLIWFRVDSGNWNNNPAANPATGAGGISFAALSTAAHAFTCPTSNTTDGGTTDFTGSGAPSGFGGL